VSVTLSRAATETNVSVANLLTDIRDVLDDAPGRGRTGRHRHHRVGHGQSSVLHRCGPNIVRLTAKNALALGFTEGQPPPEREPDCRGGGARRTASSAPT